MSVSRTELIGTSLRLLSDASELKSQQTAFPSHVFILFIFLPLF